MNLGNKKISFLNFNYFEEERLEEYLNEEADKGWLLKKFNNLYMTFEKTDRKNFKYNVTSNSKDFYMNEKEYKSRYEECDMEYIFGNNIFQIAILNKENEKKIKSEVNIKQKLKYDFVRLFALIMLCFFNWDKFRSYKDESYLLFIAENETIILFIYVLIALLFLIKHVISDAIWNINYFFRKKTKIRDLRKIKNDSKILAVTFFIILILLFVNIATILFDNSFFSEISSNSKESLPLKLEDFNMKIEEKRESSADKNDSLLASYYTYYDYTYYTKYSNKDNEPNVEEFLGDGISYEVFTSKYEKIMKDAINARIHGYANYTFDDYKKSTKGKEVELWKAKVIYTNKDTKEKIIVYDNKFLYLDININYDEKNITLIKNKLLNL